ncbi:MAG: hypothetical protein OEU36_17075 [Gammaproteobacteria bacterium]|nr:hypothetical protein [Gammaproteobacteria bacterium]
MTSKLPLKGDVFDYIRAARVVPGETLRIEKVWNLIRFYRVWKASLSVDASPVKDKSPWMTFSAIEFLDRFLDKEKTVFEYGCGGSSLFFARRARHVISAEHDPAWAELVDKEIGEAGYGNWQCRVVEPTHNDGQCDSGYSSRGKSLRDKCFEAYAKTITAYPDKSFDVVVIDGRARVGCAIHAVNKVAEHGCFVLDNSERDWYAPIHELLKGYGWKRYNFFGPGPYNRYFWATTIWRNLG